MAYTNRRGFGEWVLIGRVAVLPFQVGNQQRVVIPDQPTCKACAIVIGPKRVSIGDTEHPTAGLGGYISATPVF